MIDVVAHLGHRGDYHLLSNGLIIRSEQVAEQRLAPCLEQTDSDMTKHLSRSLSECVKMALYIGKQEVVCTQWATKSSL
jgi:hypothetical protein